MGFAWWGSFQTPGVTTIFLATSAKSVPNTVIFRHGAESFTLVEISKNKFLELTKQLRILSPEIQAAVARIYYRKPKEFTEVDIKSVSRFPEIFKVTKLNFAQLHAKLTKKGWPQSAIEKLIGVPPQGTEIKADYKFDNAKIYLPDGMQKSRQQIIFKTLIEAKKGLAKFGFDYLITNGIIKVMKLPPRKLGQYMVGTSEFQISSETKALTESGLHIIYHELNHKLYHEFMKPDARRLVSDTYNQVVKGAKSEFNPKSIQMGKIITHSGLNEPELKGIQYRLHKFTKEQVAEYKKLGATLTSTGWYAINLDKNAPTIKRVLPIGNRMEAFGLYTKAEASEWFPSEYAKSTSEEFFAELFASYIQGTTAKLQTEWMKRILKPYQK